MNKRLFFQGLQVAGKVPIGDVEIFLQGIKIHRIIYRKGRHDTESDPALKCFVQTIDGYFHLSYLKCMRIP